MRAKVGTRLIAMLLGRAMYRFLSAIVTAMVLGGCASYGVVENARGPAEEGQPSYSIRTFQEQWRTDENAVMLAFSGGGTRAAALAYGVLKALRDTPVPSSTGRERLLDEVHSISSVSGGSFTAAYYGLHGDRIFEDYEDVFLRKNVQGALIRRLLNPLSWFGRAGRTEMAIKYYDKTVFQGATFTDMLRPDRPMVVINASDLGGGVRFSFVQEYFNLLCSDLSSFPVARAVTASSAVPVLFNPVVVRNFPDCGDKEAAFLRAARNRVADQPELALMVEGLETYFDRDRRQYIHFVDGGITDNLGLRSLYEVIEVNGGMADYSKKYQRVSPRRLVLISVNAATDPARDMDLTAKQPSVPAVVGTMSDVQLHRYNIGTIALMKDSLERWARELSTPEWPVESYFILLDFHGIQEDKERLFLNQTPTSFSLTDEQVDGLIEAGGELLRNHPEFLRLVVDMAAEAHAGH
jgi:NTE family protein